MIYTTRPLSDRTWLRPDRERQASRFDTHWSATLRQLGRELEHLGASRVVIECDVREQDIRLDGMLRANAKADTPAVVVAFESKHGPMLYRCDRYSGAWGGGPLTPWQHNVRAITLTLESLRAVDRYGAVDTGQQYAGFKALPAGRAMPASHMTREDAVYLLDEYADHDWSSRDSDSLRRVYRLARAATHPDRNDGDRSLWDKVEQAATVLGVV